jgi:hypothetical protein
MASPQREAEVEQGDLYLPAMTPVFDLIPVWADVHSSHRIPALVRTQCESAGIEVFVKRIPVSG